MAKQKTKFMQDLSESALRTRVRLLCLNLFEWEGLPESVDPLYLEEQLYTKGEAGIVKNAKFGVVGLGISGKQDLNLYYRPQTMRVVGNGGFNQSFKPYMGDNVIFPASGVHIKNNDAAQSTLLMVEPYIDKLDKIDNTINQVLIASSVPFIFTGEERDKVTFNNVLKQIEEYAPAIFVKSGLGTMEGLSTLDIKTAQTTTLTELYQIKKIVWGELLEVLGIESLSFEKNAHMLNAEVDASKDATNFNIDLMLKTREQAAEYMNTLWGLSVRVHLKNDIVNEYNEEDSEQSEETTEEE